MADNRSVFPDWMLELPFQQQSVLVLALRGPDNVRKHHPMKDIQRCYRGTVLKAAKYGRLLEVGEPADSFMGMAPMTDRWAWGTACRDYFHHVDELPHHFHMHLMHGAQILGYKHPNLEIAGLWQMFYYDCCDDAHVEPESMETMDKRLGDWDQEFWGPRV